MKTNPRLEAANARLTALRNEVCELNATIEAVKAAEARLKDIGDGWSRIGELTLARRAVRDARFPAIEWPWTYDNKRMVIGVDDKWVTLLHPCASVSCAVRFNRLTGMQEHKRNDSYKRDITPAVAAWEAWCAEYGTPEPLKPGEY